MKILVCDQQSDKVYGSIEWDGKRFQYENPNMVKGLEKVYVEQFGVAKALENMVGVANGYYYIKAADESAPTPEEEAPVDG